ncbi:LD-carboxypeptidase [Candidatus Peribacteria bacterium]|nr:LD-carboxypeptidase [Candidatus Peribacteria bacterium]
MFAPKLKKGDGVRIIAPARSLMLPWMSNELKETAQKRLESLGLRVSFGKYVNERDEFDSTTIEHRIEDLHDAFADDSIQIILTVIGGFNSNQLLRYIDYDLVRNNPKILCGYSDITALATAFYSKTDVVTYSGPHFFNFGQKQNFEYTMNHFKKCFFEEDPIILHPSEKYVDDLWATKQDDVQMLPNNGWHILQEGNAKGVIIGGNLGTFHLLHGTEYMPNPSEDVILFIEDDRDDHPAAFDRNLQSLLHQDFAKRIRGVAIGRSEIKSGISLELLSKIIASKLELQNIPVVAGLDFGHTTPMFTFPIGGRAAMSVSAQEASIVIDQH